MDKATFAQIMAPVFTIYGAKQYSSEEESKRAMSVYYTVLGELPEMALKASVSAVMASRKFSGMPMPAELLEHAQGGSVDDLAILAIDRLERAMATIGAYKTVMFDDPLLHAIVDGYDSQWGKGWPGLCLTPLEQLKFTRKDLIKQYAALKRSGKQYNAKPLAGIHEMEGGKYRVVRIGDAGRINAMIASEDKSGEVLKQLGLEG